MLSCVLCNINEERTVYIAVLVCDNFCLLSLLHDYVSFVLFLACFKTTIMVKETKLRQKQEEEVLTLKDVIDLGGTKEDFESLKDIRDGTGTGKRGKKSKKSLKVLLDMNRALAYFVNHHIFSCIIKTR